MGSSRAAGFDRHRQSPCRHHETLPSSPGGKGSTLHRLIFLAISSAASVRLMRLPSASADLDILAVPSTSDITRAPAGGISASGT
jgi:hypothetical protein